ncbi:MAG: DUF3501 family protein [Gammaproteobacteria bacterium]|nr:DUF3501 family protein [Gammaproteobacteria bacterium]
MNKLSKDDLMSLETYAQKRAAYRADVMAHKKTRRVALGPNATLYFEDRLTMQYQIQEILRIEKIFEAEAIEEELAAYNPLIPDGANWKATFMLEFEDENERRAQLAKLIGVERNIWARVGEHEKVAPIANEDLVRETDEKTSAVHFLRFELSAAMAADAKSGAEIHIGVEHPHYTHASGALPAAIAKSLAADLDARH